MISECIQYFVLYFFKQRKHYTDAIYGFNYYIFMHLIE